MCKIFFLHEKDLFLFWTLRKLMLYIYSVFLLFQVQFTIHGTYYANHYTIQMFVEKNDECIFQRFKVEELSASLRSILLLYYLGISKTFVYSFKTHD